MKNSLINKLVVFAALVMIAGLFYLFNPNAHQEEVVMPTEQATTTSQQSTVSSTTDITQSNL